MQIMDKFETSVDMFMKKLDKFHSAMVIIARDVLIFKTTRRLAGTSAGVQLLGYGNGW